LERAHKNYECQREWIIQEDASMPRVLLYLLELIGVGGIIGLMAFIPWTKMALGGALAFLGAFFPSLKDARQSQSGDGQLTWRKVAVKFSGGVRFAVVMGGIVLLVGAVLEGHDGFTKVKEVGAKLEAEARTKRLQRAFERLEAQKNVTREYVPYAGDDDLSDTYRFLLEELAKEEAAK
jgi:hypothetical protein